LTQRRRLSSTWDIGCKLMWVAGKDVFASNPPQPRQRRKWRPDAHIGRQRERVAARVGHGEYGRDRRSSTGRPSSCAGVLRSDAGWEDCLVHSRRPAQADLHVLPSGPGPGGSGRAHRPAVCGLPTPDIARAFLVRETPPNDRSLHERRQSSIEQRARVGDDSNRQHKPPLPIRLIPEPDDRLSQSPHRQPSG